MKVRSFARLLAALMLLATAIPASATDGASVAWFRGLMAQRGDRAMKLMSEMFPKEYAAEELLIARQYGPTHDEDAALVELTRFGNQIRSKYFYQISAAPDADLMAIENARLAWFGQLQRIDPVLCYEVGEGLPVEPDREARILHVRRDPGTDVGLKLLIALKHAQEKPVSRGDVTREDYALIVREYVRRGGSVQYLQQTDRDIAPEDRCKYVNALIGAVKAAPIDTASRYLANEFRQSGHSG